MVEVFVPACHLTQLGTIVVSAQSTGRVLSKVPLRPPQPYMISLLR